MAGLSAPCSPRSASDTAYESTQHTFSPGPPRILRIVVYVVIVAQWARLPK